MGLKHVVILGAGSTIATIPNGDKNGMYSFTLANLLKDPYFADFVETLSTTQQNMETEALCQDLYTNNRTKYAELEALIRAKYGSLTLPDEFTILEKLILSLTSDDVIISFNWDDLVIQAYNRVLKDTNEKFLPQIFFPHGNAMACYDEKRYGTKRNPQNTNLKESPLNMPVDEMEYKNDLFIQFQWGMADAYISHCRMITFFGYQGPSSDTQDMEHLYNLLKGNEILARVEIIDKDIDTARAIADKWKSLVALSEHTADLCDNFYGSRIARYPRRSIASLDNWNDNHSDKQIKECDDKYTVNQKIADLIWDETEN